MAASDDSRKRRVNEPRSLEAEGYLVRGLRRLGEGLGPYVYERTKSPELIRDGAVTRDVYYILSNMVQVRGNWDRFFQEELGHSGRGSVNQLFDFRNGAWAHLVGYDDSDAHHYLGVIQRLLEAISAHEQANQVAQYYEELGIILYADGRARGGARNAPAIAPLEEGEEELGARRSARLRSSDGEEAIAEAEEDGGPDAGGEATESLEDPNAAVAQELIDFGRAAYEDGKAEVAATFLDVARRLGGGEGLGEGDAAIYVASGNALAERGAFLDALPHYDAAMKIDESLDLSRQYGSALDGRAKVLSPLPESGYSGEHFFGISEQADVSEDNLRAALSDYGEALKADPANARAYHHDMGQVLFALGNYEAAVERFTASLESEGEGEAYFNPGDALFNRGQARFAQGEYELALADFEAADAIPSADRVRPKSGGAKSRQNGTSTFRIAATFNSRKARIRALARRSAGLKLRPEESEAHLDRGRAYLAIGHRDLGIADFSEARRVNSQCAPEASLLTGRAYLGKEDYSTAIAAFEEARLLGEARLEELGHDIDLYFAEAYGSRGIDHIQSKQYELAVDDFRSVLKHVPDHPSAYFDLGRAHLAMGDHPSAIENYRATLVALEHLAESEDEFDDYIDVDPDSYLGGLPEEFEVHMELGRAHAAAEQYTLAIEAFDAALDDIGGDPDLLNDFGVAIFNGRGTANYWLEDYHQAIDDYSEAMQWGHFRANSRLWRNRGLAHYRSGQYEQALEDFDAYLGVRPEDELIQERRDAARRLLNAETEFDRDILENPNNPEVYYWRGTQYAEAGDCQKALDDFSRALELHERANGLPGQPGAGPRPEGEGNDGLHLLTEILLGRAEANDCLGRDDDALKDLDQLLASDPRCARGYDHRGRLYQREQKPEAQKAALDQFDRALGIDPQYAEAYQHRGILHLSLGEREKARADFEMARSLGLQP